ncbi:MAG: 3-phosphoshikimate 1-carboxyvinyltransferase [Dehalococcoidia bacterium]|nr:3-phosphoshikimate 1-carboxyvinyltransferase [Dehalococcoidia bacterium]
MDFIAIQPVACPIDAVIELPGSKSYSNRALLIAALAEGRSEITHALFSDDTHYMRGALEALGIRVEAEESAQRFTVEGQGGNFSVTTAELFTGNAGTAARFLTAAVAVGRGTYIVDGSERMRQRPIQPLLDGLQQLGVDAHARFDNGCPPVIVRAKGIPGGRARVRGDISSQYISALLMAAPYAERDVEIEIEGELVSAPYIGMTLGIMADFGVRVERVGDDRFRVPSGQVYRGRTYAVEPDASSASYFFAAAAVTMGSVRVPRLGSGSAQGDLGLLEVLERMGCKVIREENAIEVEGPRRLRAVEADFTQMGDVATTLMAIAPFADGPVTVRGIAQTHYEESDRPVAAATELRRMGIRVDETWDSLTIYPGIPQPALIQTYDDHRIAMSFAITGLLVPGIAIANPACVAKTFPEFFDALAVVTTPDFDSGE